MLEAQGLADQDIENELAELEKSLHAEEQDDDKLLQQLDKLRIAEVPTEEVPPKEEQQSTTTVNTQPQQALA